MAEVMKYVVEKLKEALLAVENFGGEAMAWFGHWFHVALPFLIAAAVLTVVVCFCRCCGGMVLTVVFNFCRCFCRGFLKVVSYFCSCCRRCCCGTVRMMKAPGRNIMMPRNVFVSDPRGYFQALRGDRLC
ncbi:hypothetical protein BUALT_Bualt17G0084600 [Buddleja alternifolia]|uniref:Uncharacterized protein n=1 Tax=Buddleja alternifolia TaxID=168488 RepID=A0AAV6WG72_9LAMI|nr:hypothetical protein BUALT_Bualt17G0084600 [Buddleja alternifolia]